MNMEMVPVNTFHTGELIDLQLFIIDPALKIIGVKKFNTAFPTMPNDDFHEYRSKSIQD